VDDDTEPRGDVVGTEPPAAHVVGDATGDLELVRGGGGGGIRLFCRSGVRSGTGGLPASDDVLLHRRTPGFGATAVVDDTAVVAAAAIASVDCTAATTVVAAAAAATTSAAVVVTAAAAAAEEEDADGIVWSSSSKVSSAFSAPVGSRFPALPSGLDPVCSTTLPCPTTLPCENQTDNNCLKCVTL